MKIFHLSAECYPVAKVGGLADVVGALPKYLNKELAEASVVMPKYANELSSLIILSVAGGAFIPPIMGVMSDLFGIASGIFVLIICMTYIAFATYYAIKTKPTDTKI